MGETLRSPAPGHGRAPALDVSKRVIPLGEGRATGTAKLRGRGYREQGRGGKMGRGEEREKGGRGSRQHRGVNREKGTALDHFLGLRSVRKP